MAQFELNWKQYVSILLGLYILSAIYAALVGPKSDNASLLLILGGAIIGVLGIVTQIGLLTVIVKKDPNMTVSGAYKQGLALFWSYLWVSVIVGIFVMLGFIALIIPGIYLGVCYAFAALVLVDEGKKGTQALGRSKELVKSAWWTVFARFIVLGMIGVVIYLPIGWLFGQNLFGQLVQALVSIVWVPVATL